MSTKFKFNNDWELRPGRIVVRQEGMEEKTEGGLLIPDRVREKSKKPIGEVVFFGRLPEDDYWKQIKRGTKVLFNDGAGRPIEVEEQEFLLLTLESDVQFIKKD